MREEVEEEWGGARALSEVLPLAIVRLTFLMALGAGVPGSLGLARQSLPQKQKSLFYFCS